MTMKRTIAMIMALALAGAALHAQPYGLRTDLIERTDIVYSGGYPSSMTLAEADLSISGVQYAAVRDLRPTFSWIVDGAGKRDVVQSAYRIVLVRVLPKERGVADYRTVWDSGRVESNVSTAVRYPGAPLEPDAVYSWTVQTWDREGRASLPSAPKMFRTSPAGVSGAVSIEPVVKTDQYATSMGLTPSGNAFFDFGKAAFGQLRITLTSREGGEKIILHLGERVRDGAVDREPAGTTRYRRIELTLMQGTHTYAPGILPDWRNTHGDAVLMPGYIGEVMPFRYLEIEGCSHQLAVTDVVRQYVHHPFNGFASDFKCSDGTLNSLWELCKYSMEATSFIGYHIDGDRERIPYELDALINQLAWYGTEASYSLSRRSLLHLLEHPTWPTEWILQSVLIAWYDYLYTGDARVLESQYGLLERHTLLSLKGANGLISTRTAEQDKDFLAGINRRDSIRDIVDWPQGRGSFGLAESDPGEADFFEFKDYNTVVNAYHYETLVLMARIAEAIGRDDDAAAWKAEAGRVEERFNALLLMPRKGCYRDGEGSDHSALHSNMFPLAFGLVPEKQREKVASYVESRGPACSIGNAKFLLDGLYDSFEGDYAYEFMTAVHDRSWYNTILSGSTISFEAWDDHYKPNQDWNHAWGAALADIIPHKFLGVEPLEAAWNRVRIRPQVSSVSHAEGVVPTIKGPVSVDIDNQSTGYVLTVETPANTAAQIWVPVRPSGRLMEDGVSVTAPRDPSGRFYVLENVGSGKRVYESR